MYPPHEMTIDKSKVVIIILRQIYSEKVIYI